MKSAIDIHDTEYIKTQGNIVARFGMPKAATPCPVDSRTGKINPHVTRFYHSGKQVTDIHHVKPVYYEHAKGELVFRPLYEVCEHYGNHLVVFKWEKLADVHPRFIAWLEKRMQLIGGKILVTSPWGKEREYGYAHRTVHNAVARPKVGLTVTTVYPDPNTETTTVDGMVTATSTVFATVRNATTGTPNDTATTTGSDVQCSTFSGTYYFGRGFFLFDTSAIPDSDTIDSAVFSQYTTGSYSDADSTTFECVETSPASNTAIAAGDYDNFTNTSGGNRALYNTTGYKDITLNATGEGWISKTGVTKLGIIGGRDLNNSAPTGLNRDVFYFADQSGTSNDPKLAVTHSGGTAYTQDVNEAVGIADSDQLDITKDFSEGATASDSVAKGITQTFTENVDVTASSSTLQVFLKELSESVTATASLAGMAITKTFSEAVDAADSLVKDITRTLSEAVDATASAAAATATYIQSIVESVTASDSLTKVVGYVRDFTESVAVTDRVKAALNGINAFWHDIYTDTADAWSDIYQDN